MNMDKFIKFLVEYESFNVGDLGKCAADLADELIEKGIAEAVDATGKTVTAVEAKAAELDIAAQVKAAVAEAIAEQQKAQTPTAKAVTRPRAEDDPKKGFTHFGEYIKSVKEAATNPSRVDERLLYGTKAPSGMSVGVDSDGGFLVP